MISKHSLLTFPSASLIKSATVACLKTGFGLRSRSGCLFSRSGRCPIRAIGCHQNTFSARAGSFFPIKTVRVTPSKRARRAACEGMEPARATNWHNRSASSHPHQATIISQAQDKATRRRGCDKRNENDRWRVSFTPYADVLCLRQGHLLTPLPQAHGSPESSAGEHECFRRISNPINSERLKRIKELSERESERVNAWWIVEECTEEIDRLRGIIEKERDAVARFLVPYQFHLPESWLDHFVESGIVYFDAIGYVSAMPIDGIESETPNPPQSI